MLITVKRRSFPPSSFFLQFRVKRRDQRGLKVTIARGYNLESLWLCFLQNQVEELNQRLRQAIDGQCKLMLQIMQLQSTPAIC